MMSKMRGKRDDEDGRAARALGWVSEHPLADAGLAVVVAGGHTAFVLSTGHTDVLAWLDPVGYRSVLSTGASVVALLGGLTSISLAVYQTASGRRMLALRRAFPGQLRANWRWSLIATGVAATLCLIAVALSRAPLDPSRPVDPDPFHFRFVFEAALVLWASSFVRLVWLFDRLLGNQDADATDVGRAPAPSVDPSWVDRTRSKAS